MDEYLNKGIKDLLKGSPSAGEILTSFGIGCAPCNVGTCLLKDVVKIHSLTPENEQKLMEALFEEFSQAKAQ